MKHKKFEAKKVSFDNKVMLYLMHKLFTDIKNSDAFKEELIDGVGNSNNPQRNDNAWAFTSLDKWLLNFKDKTQDELKTDLKKYSWLKDIDPLYLINIEEPTTVDFKKLLNGWRQLISLIEDVEFLPDNVKRSNNYIELEDTNDRTFRDRLTFSTTILTILIYSLINERMPSSVDFVNSVCPSIETCFWVTPYKDYEKCVAYLKENKLIDEYNKITKKAMVLLVSAAKVSVENDLLNKKIEREENKYNIWEKLSKM
jgi:hypothetical protein